MTIKNNSTLKAILSCLIAATLWGILWYPLRLLEQMGLPGLWATLLIYAPALIVVLPFYFKSHIRITHPLWWLGIALAAGWTNLAFILAMLEGTVVRVLLLFYLSPVWTVVLGHFILKEPLTRQSLFNLVLALSGAVILLWSDELKLTSTIGYVDWLAITSGMAFSITNVLVRKIGDVPIILKMVPAWAGVLILTVIGITMGGGEVPLITPTAFLCASAVGVLGMVLMTYTAQYGVTHLPVQQSAVIFLFEVPVGAVSAALLATEVMTVREWIGGVLVLIAAWLTATSGMKDSSDAAS